MKTVVDKTLHNLMMHAGLCIYTLFPGFFFVGCSSGEVELANNYSYSAEASPPEAGTVDPSSGMFLEGEEVIVSASASAGWEFEKWTGDIESEENPLIFSIRQNIHVTANFFQFRSEYSVTVTLADVEDEFILEFGQHENASQLSQSSPPPPPGGALHAWFQRSEDEWIKDYRSDHENEADWELYFQAGSDETITLSWQTDAVRMEGLLTLTDVTGTFQIDMTEENTYEFEVNEHEYLVIEYRL